MATAVAIGSRDERAFLSGPAVGWMGSRRLLLLSRGVGNLGLAVLAILLSVDALSMPVLAILTFVASAAAGPAAAADTARFPELTRLARIRLGRFNAVNEATMSLASLSGLLASAWLVAHWGVTTTLYLALAAGTLALLALAYARIEHRMRTVATLRACLLVFSLSLLVLASAPVFATALALAVVTGFTFGILGPFTETQIQRHSPA